ncbi:hypothetical protein HQ560_19310 [bacterium]|nr:hypothetical protein [bacterium]
MLDRTARRPARSLAAVGLLALAVTGCNSTRLVGTWAAPDAGPITFKKVLVVCISSSPVSRRSTEDALVKQISRAQATASYTLLSEDEVRDEKAVRAKMAGFDGALTLRVVKVSQETSYVGGSYPTYYGRFGSYRRRGWSGAYNPGRRQVDDIVRVETHIYSVKDDKLIWAGTSETVNAYSVESAVTELAKAVAKDLRKRGLVPPKSK